MGRVGQNFLAHQKLRGLVIELCIILMTLHSTLFLLRVLYMCCRESIQQNAGCKLLCYISRKFDCAIKCYLRASTTCAIKNQDVNTQAMCAAKSP